MSSATSIVPYMGTLAIFLIFVGPAYATVGFDCNTKMQYISNVSFADLLLNEESSRNMKVFATQRPNDFAYIFMNRPGYMAIVKDDTFQIMGCKPVVVELQPQNECYDQLPIVQGNQRLFMNPWTLIITDKASEIPCNAPILGEYQLNGMSYKVTPRPVSPVVPQRLKPKTKLTWNYKEPADLMNSGILNEEQVNRAWEYQRHPEQFNPPPSRVYVYPDANGNTPGVTNTNKGSNPWYKISDTEDLIVMVAVAIGGLLLLTCVIKMVVDRIKHGNAFHSINQCRRRRHTSPNQADITNRLNKTPDV